MANIIENQKRKKWHKPFNHDEKAILSQIAKLLTNENLITPEEQTRFLTVLKEEI